MTKIWSVLTPNVFGAFYQIIESLSDFIFSISSKVGGLAGIPGCHQGTSHWPEMDNTTSLKALGKS